MRGKPKSAERRIEATIAALVAALAGARVPWMVIGGIAVIARGVRRMTTDVDAVLQGDAMDMVSLLKLFARRAIVPRMPNAAAFARENHVLLLRHDRRKRAKVVASGERDAAVMARISPSPTPEAPCA